MIDPMPGLDDWITGHDGQDFFDNEQEPEEIDADLELDRWRDLQDEKENDNAER